jgi:uncharacterized protein YprB with RNaseH-like and TPR domain
VKLLGLDIETAPAIAYVWRLHDENIGLDQLIQPSRVLCWSAKWFGEKGTMYADERKGAKKMLQGIRELLAEADAVVTYNGDSFDLAKLNGEFVYHRIDPAPPVASIDLFKTVRNLGYISGKLAFVGPHLKIGEKIKNEGFALWASCMKGDKEAWRKMEKYNRQDTAMLEGLYEVLRPYIKNHPHMGGPKQTRAPITCPVCQSEKTVLRGTRRTKVSVIARVQCLSCGSWSDGPRSRAA